MFIVTDWSWTNNDHKNRSEHCKWMFIDGPILDVNDNTVQGHTHSVINNHRQLY